MQPVFTAVRRSDLYLLCHEGAADVAEGTVHQIPRLPWPHRMPAPSVAFPGMPRDRSTARLWPHDLWSLEAALLTQPCAGLYLWAGFGEVLTAGALSTCQLRVLRNSARPFTSRPCAVTAVPSTLPHRPATHGTGDGWLQSTPRAPTPDTTCGARL